MKSTFRKTVLLLLSLVMLFSLTATAAFAEQQGDQTDAEESALEFVESTWAEAYPTDRSENNAELLNAYAQVQLDRASGSEVGAASTGYALEKLREEYPTMAKIYEAILPEIQAIAAGERTSTEITGSLADLEGVQLTYTAQDLHLDSITSENKDAAYAEALRLAGLTAVSNMIDALLSDCAYELYWFDKTAGCPYGFGYSLNSEQLTLTAYRLRFTVASAFADGDSYTVSTASADTIHQAIQTAQGIVQAASYRADWSKLNYYRQQICNLTDYNHDAANDEIDTPYGNPWQLIWVFDGDPDTTVVCEGYAKAFAYLCELTNAQNGFENVECYLVSGRMAGGTGSGPHMWNVVRLDGRNYLVDVTNCDDGSIGAPAQLFMVGYDSVDTTGAYQFACEGGNILYAYDNDSINTYGTEKLNLVSKAEITAPTEGRTVTLTVNGNTETATARAKETVTMLIQAPGATGLRIWEPVEEEWSYYGHNFNLSYFEYRNSYTPGEWSLYAQACYNELSGGIYEPGEAQWTTLSNEVTLTVPEPTETYPAPNVTLNGTINPVSVNRGDWLHAVITDPAGEGEWYQSKILKKIDDDNYYHEMEGEYYSFETANELYIPAAHFAPGDYALCVYGAAAGYKDSAEVYRFFTVTDEAPTSGLKLSADSTPYLRSITVCGYVPGADHMQLSATREGDPYWSQSEEWWEELFYHPIRYSEPGEYTLTLTAWSENDELLGTYTAAVTFTEMENARLKTPDLSSFPRILKSGEEFSGTIGLDERAENLYITIAFYPDEGDSQIIYTSIRDSMDGEDWTTVNLPADLFTEAGQYDLSVYNYGSDIISSGTTLSFLREEDDAPTGDLVLTANGSMADIDSWNSWKFISVEVSSQSATAVRILGGNNWDYADMSGGSVTRDYCLGDGDYTLVAQMTTDDPVWRGDDDYWNTHSWDELNWTSLSNAVALHVSSPNGQLAKPQLTMTPADGEVTKGAPVTVITASQTAQGQTAREWIRATLMRLEGMDSDNPYWTFEGEYGGDETLQTLIPTWNLEPGVYRLDVMMSAEGWLSNENHVYFTVLPKTAETVTDGSSFIFITQDEGIFPGQYSGSKLITPAESGFYTFTVSFEGNPTIQQNQAYLGITGTDVQDRSFDTAVPASMMFSATLTEGEEYELVLSNLEALGTLNVNAAVNYGVIPFDNTLVLPASLTEIGEEAFAGVAAQRIDLPVGIENIGSRAFADSESLCFVVIPNVSVQIDSTAFQNSPYVRIAAPDGGAVKAFAINAGIPFIPLPAEPQS